MSTEERLKRKTRSELLHEIVDRFGVSEDRRSMCIAAFRILNKDELKVVIAILDLANSGISLERRNAISRGIVQAIRESNASDRP